MEQPDSSGDVSPLQREKERSEGEREMEDSAAVST